MRRNAFLGQVLTAVARSAPATNLARSPLTDTETARPASQLLTAIARTTPAFTPGSNPTLDTRPTAVRQPRPATRMPHAAPDASIAEDVIEVGYRIPSVRQRRSYRQALVVALSAFAIPVIVASALIIKAALHPAPNTYPLPLGPVSPAASTSALPSPLMTALVQANQSGEATGKLPPSSCRQDSATHVTCTTPASGITGAVFQTYPSLKALYAAYKSTVAAVNSGQFRQNFNDCGSQASYGEVGWNHLFQHTTKYTVDQMTTGIVKDDQAAGRVFCNYTQGLQYIVWTQNDGRLMAYVAGPVHTDVWDWWAAVHHNIGIGGQQENLLVGGAAMATLGSYLSRTAAMRPTIQSAIDGVQGCSESPAAGEAALQRVINTRQDILSALPRLSVSGLPNGAELVSTLTTAMKDSITADKDYQRWMKDFASSGTPCGSDPTQDSHYAAGENASVAATTAKNAFVAIWNPMASRYGQQAYSSTEF